MKTLHQFILEGLGVFFPSVPAPIETSLQQKNMQHLADASFRSVVKQRAKRISFKQPKGKEAKY